MQTKIYVIGYYGYDSLGDEAMLIGLSEILSYKGYENVRFYRKGSNILKDVLWADTVILGGGTHLRDWGNRWLKQSGRIILLGSFIKLLGKKFCMLNVGIDGKFLEYLANKVSDVVTLREFETFDSSIVIDFKPQKRMRILGISLMNYYNTFCNDYDMDSKLVKNLMTKVNEWLKVNPDYVVRFYNFNKIDEFINLEAAKYLNHNEFIDYDNDVVKILESMSECEYFIPMRYHACQFAYHVGIPMLVVNTYPSCKQFAKFVRTNSVDKEDILSSNFRLDFKKAELDLNMAKSLAFGGIKL